MDIRLPAQLRRPLQVSASIRLVPPLGQAAVVDALPPARPLERPVRLLRRGDSTDAFVLAVQEGEAQARTTAPGRAARGRAQFAAQKGGADAIFDEKGGRTGGARMTAVVTLQPGQAGRHYRLPTDVDYAAVRKAQERVAGIFNAWEREGKQGLCPVPDEPLPPIGTLGFRVQRYGMLQWGDLFTARQKVALATIGGVVAEVTENSPGSGLMGLLIGKVVDMNNSLSSWQPHAEIPAHMMTRWAIPMKWDFSEAVPISESSGTMTSALKRTLEPLPTVSVISRWASSHQADVTEHPLPDQSAGVWFTDPPYYDAVPYADLSDFFLVWIERALPDHPLMRDPFDPDNPLSPKTAEAVQDETKQTDGQPKDREWFEETIAKAFTASVALRRLAGFSAKNGFYRANRDLGRILKTEFILQYMSEPALRTRIRRGLLKVEQMHALARDVFYGNRGRINARDLWEQMNSCSCLTLIVACIIYWQARDMSRVIRTADPERHGIELSLLRHVSPIEWDNIVLYGEYVLNRRLVRRSRSRP